MLHQSLADGGRLVRGVVVQGQVVARYWLRPVAFAKASRGLSLARRLWLSASVPQRHERDTYLWSHAHKENFPYCPICGDTTDEQQPREGSND